MKLKKSIKISTNLIIILVLLGMVPISSCNFGGAKEKIKVCQVTNNDGIKDYALNSRTWEGVKNAKKNLGIQGRNLKSDDFTDYDKNIDTSIDRDCDLIITIGPDLADSTASAAAAHPEVIFSIVDYDFDPDINNIAEQVYDMDEGAFLAGYLAASVTRTGVVGTFGGEPTKSVTNAMDSFARGVSWYNDIKNDNVDVIGWDIATQTGLFTDSFTDEQKSSNLAIQLMDLGTDIIMPVAGKSGLGAAITIFGRGNAYMIGFGYDWALANFKYADITLTSVVKNADITTYLVIEELLGGRFVGGNLTGNLENGGVSLAPFYKLDPMVNELVRAELEQIRIDIISGIIPIIHE